LDVIDDQSVDGNLFGFQFEAELFLDGHEDARAGIGWCIGLRGGV
jgi:hypothetical protein